MPHPATSNSPGAPEPFQPASLRRSPTLLGPLAATALALALVLSACGGDRLGPDEDAEDDGSVVGEDPGDGADDQANPGDDAESSGDPDDDEPPALTIRDIDFATLEWREAVSEFHVTPATHDDAQTIVIGERVAYADVDGDGHEDALVPLQITEEQSFEQIWYIWTWDSENETAVQVQSPVAREARCGNRVLEIGAEDSAFTITEALRYQGSQDIDCASDGPIEVTRHVTLENGWPVLTGDLSGDGGICPQPVGTDDLWPVEDIPLHPAPFDDAGEVTEPEPYAFGEVDVWDHLWLFREHWMLVHIAYLNPVDGPPVSEGYTPCAWIYLENDGRPIPHDPYREA